MKLFNFFKKKPKSEPVLQGGLIESLSAFGEVLKKMNKQILYGTPVSSTDTHINIFILKQSISTSTDKQLENAKEICNALCSSLKPVYSWVTDDLVQTMQSLNGADIVINIDDYVVNTSMTSAAHIAAKATNKKIIAIGDLKNTLKNQSLFNPRK